MLQIGAYLVSNGVGFSPKVDVGPCQSSGNGRVDGSFLLFRFSCCSLRKAVWYAGVSTVRSFGSFGTVRSVSAKSTAKLTLHDEHHGCAILVF